MRWQIDRLIARGTEGALRSSPEHCITTASAKRDIRIIEPAATARTTAGQLWSNAVFG